MSEMDDIKKFKEAKTVLWIHIILLSGLSATSIITLIIGEIGLASASLLMMILTIFATFKSLDDYYEQQTKIDRILSEMDRDVRKIDGDVTTVEELCKLMEETGGYFDGDSFSVITEGGRNRQHGRTSISPFSFPSTQIDKEKIRKSVLSAGDDYIDAVLNSFSGKVDKSHASVAINRAIQLAIEVTLREVKDAH